MSLPDFREPLILEIDLARRVNTLAYEMLPATKCQDERLDLAVALAHIALEHVAAVLWLFENGSIASGYALMRSALETTYKCIWIATTADEVKVSKAYRGNDIYGTLDSLISNLESEFDDTPWAALFSKIRPHVRVLHERTHSGKEQTMRRLNASNIKIPEYDFGKVISDIRTVAVASVLGTIPLIAPEHSKALIDLVGNSYS